MYLLSVLLAASSATMTMNGDGRPSDNDSAIFLNGECATLVQSGVLHRGVPDDTCHEMKALDAKLNATYRAEMAHLSGPAKAALRASQRQWIALRDLKCGLNEPVSVSEEPAASCFIDETRKRLAAIALSPATPGDASRIRRLAGQWVIHKAALADPEGVQAYSTDQLRALVGNRLVISEKSVAWVVSRERAVLREHTWLTDQCLNPSIKSQKAGKFDIMCVGGDSFGPEASIALLRNGNLKFDWWDGVVLYLRKAR